MFIYPFRMSSNTATMLVIKRHPTDILKSEVAIGIRGRGVEVHPGKPSLPGGFMEAKFSAEQAEFQSTMDDRGYTYEDEIHPGETLEATAIRELKEETCTDFAESQLTQYYTCSAPGLDPRAHVVNLCFYLEATPEQVASMTAGDDLEEIQWWGLHSALALNTEIAFNHRDLMQRGIRAWLKEEHYKELEAKYG